MKKNLFIFIVCLFAVISNAFAAPAPKHEFRGMWTATVMNIDWPSTASLTVDKQKAELVNLLDALQAGNVNAVCLQVRSLSDALYKSSYEPWAACLTGTRGKDPGYDPLAFAIEEAHERGMELHAWVNPFRVTSSSSEILTDAQIQNLYKAPTGKTELNPAWILNYNNGTFTGTIIDPGIPAAREYITNVLMDIVDRYDIDGILMDDYFYPYGGTTTEDATSKSQYKGNDVQDINKDGDTDDDWRRSNIDALIKNVYEAIENSSNKKHVRFGVGPFGIWTMELKAAQAYGISLPTGIVGQDTYQTLACNPIEWIKNGYVDYIAPQLYWATSTTGGRQDYGVLCEWWAKLCASFSDKLSNNKRVHFFPSHALYKLYEKNKNVTPNVIWDGFDNTIDELKLQIDFDRENPSSGYSGSLYYRTGYYNNPNNTHDVADKVYDVGEELRASHYQTKALVPPMAWKSKEVLDAPNTLRISGNTLTWQHNSAKRYTVYIYPKGIEMEEAMKESAYLQMVVYGNSFALPASFDVEKHNIAVCSYDRYGVEHSATEYEAPLPDVTYVLNGGILGKRGSVTYPKVPTQEELWTSYKTAAGLTTLGKLEEIKATAGSNPHTDADNPCGCRVICKVLTSDMVATAFGKAEWKWLQTYIMGVQTTLTDDLTAAAWRYAIAAFFLQSEHSAWPASANFAEAGKPEKWGPYYQEAKKTGTEVDLDPLPETIVGSEFLLPRGKPDYEEITHPSGCNFLGWFDNPDMTGEPLTTLSVGYTGTVYAKWDGIITWMLNGGKYTGEGTLPTTVDADYTLPTAAEMARPAYVFGGWYEDAAFITGDALTTIEAGYKGVLHAKWNPAYYVTWHPDHCHDVSNEDLWQLFMEDYNEWYYTKKGILPQPRADQPITNAIGFTFPPEETREDYHAYENGMAKEFLQGDPRWQWLDKYITDVIEKENKTLDSNAPLWTAFKEATGLIRLGSLSNMTIESICDKNALDNDVAGDGRTGGDILTELFKKEEWQWLKGYIEKVQKEQDQTLGIDLNDRKWAYAVAAFFKQSQRKTWPYSADFSTAGKHSVWKEKMPEEYHHQMAHFHVTSELDYRRNIHAFFNHSNVVEYSTNLGISKTEGTADFTVKGLPKPNGDPNAGWYQPWWDATFPEYMAGGSTLPKVARKGYVFAGWYCGTNEGYYFKPEARMNSVRGYDASNTNGKNHLWARWYELCLYEGYVKKDHHSLIEDEKVNHNVEMIYYADATTTNKSLKISIDRKFLADGVSYSTLVLPFAIPRTEKMSAGDYIKQITNENGEYVFDPDKGGQMPSILVCQGANKKTVNGEDMVEFGFKELDVESKTTGGTEPAISAYVPFLIKPKKPISARLQFWAATVYYRTNIGSAMLSGVELRPVLAPSVVQVAADYSSLILVDKNRLAQVYQDGEMLGLRGYFVVKDEWANLPAKITIRENVTTDVEEVVNTDTKVEVQKVMRNNRVYIIREGHTYDILGNKVE